MKPSMKLICVLASFHIMGCAHRYPMQMTESQWNALTPEQQATYQARQYEIDEQRRRDAQAERQAQDQTMRARADAERERIARLYAAATYGDIARVSIEGGTLDIYGKSRPAKPAAFEIARGERKAITITQDGQVQRSHDFSVTLSADGQTLVFDEGSSGEFVMVNRDWEKGQFYRMPSRPRKGRISLLGATVFIKFKETADAPQRVIIEHR